MQPKSYLEALLSSPPPAVPRLFRPDSMTLGGSTQSAQIESDQNCYMFTLPDDILCDILLLIRPDDDDQSIWRWLCRISGTCRAFRRLVRVEKKGVARLMPTVFELEDNIHNYYDEPSDFFPSAFRDGPVNLRLNLMDTIRKSDWMGSKVTSVRVLYCASVGYERRANVDRPITMALKNLLTAPCFPNLLDLEIRVPREGFSLVDEEFLRGLARVHSSLRSLFLMNAGYNPTQNEISPDVLALLSASMTCLQKVGLGVYGYEDSDTNLSVPNQHLAAFLANLNPRLTSVELRFHLRDEPVDEAFSNLSLTCPDLTSLRILSGVIRTQRIGQIIRSKRNLVSIDLNSDMFETSDEGVINAIVEMKLRLESFRVTYCDWF